MTKPSILLFARGYQTDFFPAIAGDRFDPHFVTLTSAEKRHVAAKGFPVAACFEEEFAGLEPLSVEEGYLLSSFMADRFLGGRGRPDRREVLGKEIAFWAGLLDRIRPAAVVNELVALEISEVLLIECRKRAVPYLAGMNCVVDDYFYWLPDPMTISGARFDLPQPSDRSFALAESYYDGLIQKDYRPFYVQNLANRRAVRPVIVGLLRLAQIAVRRLGDRMQGQFRYEDYREEYVKRLAVFCKSFTVRYDRLEDIPADREAIFYPLHQEPEATLNYMSAYYANQPATIENILKCLDVDQVLVVKEHPVDKGALLRGKFQDLKKRYSNLYFLPAEVHGRQVLAKATRVVTLTSTVGWEAAAIGKPVYVLGEIFYDDLGGLKRLSGFAELRERLRSPIDPAHLLGKEELIHFVARMVEMSWPGNPFPHDQLYERENLDRVVDAILGGVA